MRKSKSFFLIFVVLFATCGCHLICQDEGVIGNVDAIPSKMKLLISPDQIKSKIIEIAKTIDNEYKDEEILIIMIMKGSFVFAADLIREIKVPLSVYAITCSSYGKNGTKSNTFKLSGLDELDLDSKNVVLVDDIFDSGETLTTVIKNIEENKNVKSLKSLVLLLKNSDKRIKDVKLPDYYLFEIPNKFVIGYGCDYKEYFRGLKGIYSIN